MKALIWVLPGFLLFGGVYETHAQFLIGPRGGFGGGFRYSSGRLTVSGYFYKNYPPAVLPIAPPRPFCFGPRGIVQSQTIVQVVNPPVVVVAPVSGGVGPAAVDPSRLLPSTSNHVYDVSGVDFDLISPPKKLGPNGVIPLDKEPGEKIPKIPGKDVSVPKKIVRPEDLGKKKPFVKPKPKAEPKPEVPKKPVPKTPREKSDWQIELGRAAFANKQYGLATQRFRLASKTDPTNPRAFFLLAQGYFALNQYEEAVGAIHEGLDLDPKWPQATFHPRLELYKGIEPEFEAHLKRLKKVTASNPDSATFLFLEGYQLWFDGWPLKALPRLQKARPLVGDPSYIDLFLKAGMPGVVAAK